MTGTAARVVPAASTPCSAEWVLICHVRPTGRANNSSSSSTVKGQRKLFREYAKSRMVSAPVLQAEGSDRARNCSSSGSTMVV